MMRKSGYYKSVCLILLSYLLIFCGPKKDDKVLKLFSLEEVLTIDTENNNTAEMGLTDISYFDIDSEGKIFIANLKANENYIFILNNDGSLKSEFGRMGQGPGEFQNLKELVLSNQDEVVVTDMGKVVMYSNSGQFIKEFRMDDEYQKIIPLNRDRYLVIAVRLNPDFSQSFQVILCSSELEELKTLDSSKIESFQTETKVNIIPTLVYWEKSNKYIFTGSSDKFEIRVFDLDGKLLRTIKKANKAVSLSDNDRERYEKNLQRYPPELRESFFIPDVFPPFKDIVALDDKWLFVQTYEKSNEGSSLYDIFDTNGVFIGRTELEGYQVKIKGENLYCLRQKDSGHKELVVYRMIWD